MSLEAAIVLGVGTAALLVILWKIVSPRDGGRGRG